MVKEKSKAAEKESLHARAERHAVYVIIDAVFGMSLGLGAYSLTELPITNAHDLFAAVGFFGFSYFIIFMSWMAIRPYFEDRRLRIYKHDPVLHGLLHRHYAHTNTHNIDAIHRAHLLGNA